MTGTVIFFNSDKGYGFIDQDDCEDNLFLHISNIDREPIKGDRIVYAVVEGRKGLEAVSASIIS